MDLAPLGNYFAKRGIALKDFCAGVTTPMHFGAPREEHWATRRAAGLFDFSFMACFELTGRGVLDYLNAVQTRDARFLSSGGIAYTLLCRDDGSVFNDATLWCHEPGKWWLFTGRRADRDHLEDFASRFDVSLVDRSVRSAVLAVQGSRSLEVLKTGALDLGALRYFQFMPATLFGCACHVARIGYSGETGYEVVAQAGEATTLWESLVIAGRPLGLRECGFEAMNSLRIEAGHILFTHELSFRVTPYELGLSRLVSQHRKDYRGAAALKRLRWQTPPRKLVGLLLGPKRSFPASSVRADLPLAAATAVATSACYSPLFERDLGLGYVAWSEGYPGALVRLEDSSIARVARLPFYDPPKVLPRG